jgi:ribosome assembly protein 1
MSGQIMSSVKDGCRKAFQAQPQRLMAAMYTCSIQANAEILGKFLMHLIDFKFNILLFR